MTSQALIANWMIGLKMLLLMVAVGMHPLVVEMK